MLKEAVMFIVTALAIFDCSVGHDENEWIAAMDSLVRSAKTPDRDARDYEYFQKSSPELVVHPAS